MKRATLGAILVIAIAITAVLGVSAATTGDDDSPGPEDADRPRQVPGRRLELLARIGGQEGSRAFRRRSGGQLSRGNELRGHARNAHEARRDGDDDVRRGVTGHSFLSVLLHEQQAEVGVGQVSGVGEEVVRGDPAAGALEATGARDDLQQRRAVAQVWAARRLRGVSLCGTQPERRAAAEVDVAVDRARAVQSDVEDGLACPDVLEATMRSLAVDDRDSIALDARAAAVPRSPVVSTCPRNWSA